MLRNHYQSFDRGEQDKGVQRFDVHLERHRISVRKKGQGDYIYCSWIISNTKLSFENNSET